MAFNMDHIPMNHPVILRMNSMIPMYNTFPLESIYY